MEKDFDDSKFLSETKKRINDWFGYWGINNTSGQEDRSFLFQSQWDSSEIADNRVLGKAQLQFNHLYDFYRRAIAEQRKNTVSIEIRGTNNAKELDQNVIDIHEAVLRGIAYDSKASQVYQGCFATQLHTGYGVIRVKGIWESEKSFNQKLIIENFENPERTFFDLNAKLPDKSDGDFCGAYTSYSKDEFKKLYPDVDVNSLTGINSVQSNFTWGSSSSVTIAEVYYKEHYEETLYLLENGETLTSKEYKNLKEIVAEARLSGITDEMLEELNDSMEIKKRRKTQRVRMKSAIISGNEVIERKDHPGSMLPMVYVDGDSYKDNEQQYTQTFIKHAKDAQRFLNYCAIEIATALKNSRREQWMATPEHIKGFEKLWKNPEKQQGVMLANESRGTMPQKMPPSELPQTLLHQYQRAEQDLQAILGMYEASRGAQGNETSGVAIGNRAKQGQNAMFVYFDNLNRGIESVGRVVLDLMPQIYDAERLVSSLDKNSKASSVKINEYDPITDSYHNEIKDYNWEINVKVGASFEAQKQESLQTLVQLTQVSPDTFPMVADLIAENLDLRNTPQLVERFKNFVPPDVLAKEAGKEPPPKQPNPQEQAMQAQQQAMQAELQLQHQKIAVEKEKVQVEELKVEVDKIKAIGAMQEIPMQAEVAHVRAAAEIDKANSELEKEKIKAYTHAVSVMSKLNNAGRQSAQ